PLAVWVVVAIALYPLDRDLTEQAARLQRQDYDHDDQGHAELLAVADDVEARRSFEHVAEVSDQGLQHPDQEAASHGAARARDTADQGAGEAIEQDARHHIRVEIDDGGDQDAGYRTDRSGEAPAERQHPIDANAGEPRG